MNTKDLMEYIKVAIDLETDIATQTTLIEQSNNIVLANKPQLTLLQEPQKPVIDYVEPFKFTIANDWNNEPGVASAFLFLGVFLAIVCVLFTFVCLAEGLIGLAFLPVLLFGGLGLLCSLPFINGKKRYKRACQNAATKYAHQKERYDKKLAEVKQTNESNRKKYIHDSDEWNVFYTEMNEFFTPKLAKTKELLEKHYAINFIYPKYRSLPALTSIYEYLLTGRCEALAGANGAYNLYEDEVRKDTVISQLNTVIENLEQIRQNQYMLYQQVSAIRDTTNAITAELRQIKEYSAQTAYFSAETAAFTKLNAYYAALNERNTRYAVYQHM